MIKLYLFLLYVLKYSTTINNSDNIYKFRKKNIEGFICLTFMLWSLGKCLTFETNCNIAQCLIKIQNQVF